MSKFKKGDKVVSVKTGAKGVVDEVYGEEKYAVLFDGAANPDRVEGFQIRLANAEPPVSTNSVVRNAMAARTARNAETASQIAAKASRDAEELEAMVKKATPWRNEMRRMRSRYEQITDWWAAVPPKDDPDYGKAVAAMQRREKAIRDAGDLWFSIERS